MSFIHEDHDLLNLSCFYLSANWHDTSRWFHQQQKTQYFTTSSQQQQQQQHGGRNSIEKSSLHWKRISGRTAGWCKPCSLLSIHIRTNASRSIGNSCSSCGGGSSGSGSGSTAGAVQFTALLSLLICHFWCELLLNKAHYFKSFRHVLRCQTLKAIQSFSYSILLKFTWNETF